MTPNHKLCHLLANSAVGLVAALGEVTAGPFVGRLRDTMLADSTGRRILRDRPRITSQTLPLSMLRALPENTVGRTYAQYRDCYRLSPDGRDRVRYIDDEECAFVMQRYRECHDLYHAVLGLPPAFVEGEIALKAFEFINTGLPMTALSLFAVAMLKPKERDRFLNIYPPWALSNARRSRPMINVYWEEELDTDVGALLARLDVTRPPDMYELRRRAKGVQ